MGQKAPGRPWGLEGYLPLSLCVGFQVSSLCSPDDQCVEEKSLSGRFCIWGLGSWENRWSWSLANTWGCS